MVLICIYLMIRDVEHLFMSLFVICMFLWKNAYSGPLPVVLIIVCKSLLYILDINPLLTDHFQISSPI